MLPVSSIYYVIIICVSEALKTDLLSAGKLWEKVFSAESKDRFIETVSGHMENCKDKEIIKRQITIFREVSPDLADRLEKATGVKSYPTIKGMKFNGSHNGMEEDQKIDANGIEDSKDVKFDNGHPRGLKV